MKKKIPIAYSMIPVLWLAVIFSAVAFPGDDTKLTKTITRSFKVPGDGHVSIVNKYGPVVINSWKNDSVKVKIEITAYGKNDKSVRKVMDRVDFDFDQNNQYLELATVLDRSSGFFTELWNTIGDYSKTLLSQNQLKIEYTVFMPGTNSLDITNKFGDIYMEDFPGDLDVVLSHGNFRAGDILGRLDLDLSFGNVDANFVNEADLVLKAAECDIHRLVNADIQSSSSEIFIEEIRSLRIDSRSDRDFVVRSARSISGTATFSQIQIDTFREDLSLDLNYGSFTISNLEPGFSRLDIRGKTTEIILDFADGNYLDFEYIGDENKLYVLGNKGNLQSEYLDSNEKTVRINGFLGNKNPLPAKVIVKTESGEVNVRLTN